MNPESIVPLVIYVVGALIWAGRIIFCYGRGNGPLSIDAFTPFLIVIFWPGWLLFVGVVAMWQELDEL